MNNKEFLEIYNDIENYPSTRDVAEYFGKGMRWVQYKAKDIRENEPKSIVNRSHTRHQYLEHNSSLEDKRKIIDSCVEMYNTGETLKTIASVLDIPINKVKFLIEAIKEETDLLENREEEPKQESFSVARRIEDENKELKRRIKLLEEDIIKLEDVSSLISEVKSKPLNIIPKWTEKPLKSDSLVPVISISDMHFGEVVNPAEVNYVNEYNCEVAERRVNQVVDDFIDICINKMSNYNYPGVVLLLPGDGITGSLHDLPEFNDLSPIQQVHKLTTILCEQIVKLKQKFGKVQVFAVTGNHSRLEKYRPKTKGRVNDSLESLVYLFIQEHFQKDADVNLVFNQSDEVYFAISGRKFLLTHGDSFRGGCYPGSTEFLTETGWKRIDSYKEGDKVLQVNPQGLEASFVSPLKYINEKKDKFYTIKNNRIEFTTSEQHKHLLRKDHKKEIENKTTLELKEALETLKSGYQGELIGSFNKKEGTCINYSDDYLRLKIAVFADGSFDSRDENTMCRVSVTKTRKVNRLTDLLEKLKIPYSKKEIYHPSENTRYLFTFKMDNRDKTFPDTWYTAPKEQLEIIAEEVLYWDGSIYLRDHVGRTPMLSYCSRHKEDVQFIQYVFTATGRTCHFSEDVREGRSTIYYLSITHQSRGYGIRKDPRAKTTTTIEESYKEEERMYCFSVPTGHFVVRQNNRVFVSGNSGIGGPIIPINRGRAKKLQTANATKMPFDTMIIGHWHFHHVSDDLIICNSTKGYDEFSRSINLPYGDPGATSFFINGHGDIIYSTNLKCRDDKEIEKRDRHLEIF